MAKRFTGESFLLGLLLEVIHFLEHDDLHHLSKVFRKHSDMLVARRRSKARLKSLKHLAVLRQAIDELLDQ